MAILVTKCPHCDKDAVSMNSLYITELGASAVNGHFDCPLCRKPVSARLKKVSAGSPPHELQRYPGAFETGGWSIGEVWPRITESEAPENVPARVASNFVQAEEAARRSHREAAGMAYRRALELALKDVAPDLKGTLEKRIDALSKAGRLTPDVATWAHSVRDLGNEATHDVDEPTPEDTADLAAFTRVVLEYLYTMPAKIRRRSEPA